MEKYPFNHAYGSLLYREENYHFRYKGLRAAVINLFHVPGEECFFECCIHENSKFWKNLPQEGCKFSSISKELFQKFGVQPSGTGFFKTKEEALQNAITIIEKILEVYENDMLKGMGNNKE
ncbi:hypothetical protein [Lentibacillus sp.]|uniref:hypothetical protein n=1 Tax=Lentibacillus sp. TaxID=1925746 RepID=UPI002B4B50AB|nr:hypothetical protein [Lentibacillus sp.]HLS10448.1 hypothetical protein [Lentibacillus sp.]